MTSYYKKYEEYLPEFNHAVDIVLHELAWAYIKFMDKGVTYEIEHEISRKGDVSKSKIYPVESSRKIPQYKQIGEWLMEYNGKSEGEFPATKFTRNLWDITNEYFERVCTIEKYTSEVENELEWAQKELIDHISNLDIDFLEKRRIKSQTK